MCDIAGFRRGFDGFDGFYGFYGLLAYGWEINDFDAPWPRGRRSTRRVRRWENDTHGTMASHGR